MDEWNNSFEKQEIDNRIESNQLEVDFLVAMKEARPFIERHIGIHPCDYEAAIRVSELYGVPFDDRFLTQDGRQRRYFPEKFFTKYSPGQRSQIIFLLENFLYWKKYSYEPENHGWIESQHC